MARIISVNDTGNDNFDPNFEVYDNTDYNNDDDDNQIDSDNEYMNDGIPISNEDIENELLIESFNIGNYFNELIFFKLIIFAKLRIG